VDPYLGFDEFVVARTAALSRVAFLLTGDHHLTQDLLQVAVSRLALGALRPGDGQVVLGHGSTRTHQRQAVARAYRGEGAVSLAGAPR
jgi:hypothetical protein